MVGIYGVISYSVAQATQEIGIRMALGARPGDVLAMIFRYAGALLAAGLVLGLGGALAAGKVIATQLYGVKPSDPVTFAAVARRAALDGDRRLGHSGLPRHPRRPAHRPARRVARKSRGQFNQRLAFVARRSSASSAHSAS